MDEGSREALAKGKGELVGIASALILSYILIALEFTKVVFTLPLLAFVAKTRKENGWKVFLPSILLVVARSLIYFKGLDHYLFRVALDLYVPLSLSAAGYIWTQTKGRRVEARLLKAMAPALLATVILAVVFSVDRALFEWFYNDLKDAFAALYGSAFTTLGLDIDIDLLFYVASMTVAVFAFPFITAASCVSFFFYEDRRHSKETGWDEKIAGIELDVNLIWVIILCLLLLIVSRFMSIPLVIEMAIMSLLFTMVLVYSIQGFSVLVAWMRNRGVPLRSSALFVLLLFVSILFPGLNIVVLLTLPTLGVLENFFDLKKRRKK